MMDGKQSEVRKAKANTSRCHRRQYKNESLNHYPQSKCTFMFSITRCGLMCCIHQEDQLLWAAGYIIQDTLSFKRVY